MPIVEEPLARLSLNQKTTEYWSLAEAVEGCARAGIPWIGVWRDKLAEVGELAAGKRIRDAGLRVSSLCRGGWFPAPTAAERQIRIEDNMRAIEQTAALGSDLLVLVCGPAPNRDLQAARAMVEEGIGLIAPYAASHGVRLGIEPLHPMYAGDRSVITTLCEAYALVERLAAPNVGVVVDTYHVWWDPQLKNAIACAGNSILGFHLADWLVPTPDMLLGRGMIGDGVIDFRSIYLAVEATGYSRPIEVEIFNPAVWNCSGDSILSLMKERFLNAVYR